MVVTRDVEEIVRILLRAGADTSAQNNNGETALHFASERELEKIIWMLINVGADIEAKNHDE